MTDITLEVFRAIVLLVIVLVLHKKYDEEGIGQVTGWKYMFYGFILVFCGSLFDITDNFESLNRYIIVGDTSTQAFFEKIVGYLFGYILVATGISLWLPQISKYQANLKENLNKIQAEKDELVGIIPICMHCKEIRDDEGYWNKLEKFIESRSKVEFSHSICDPCLDKHYPEEDDEQPTSVG